MSNIKLNLDVIDDIINNIELSRPYLNSAKSLFLGNGGLPPELDYTLTISEIRQEIMELYSDIKSSIITLENLIRAINGINRNTNAFLLSLGSGSNHSFVLEDTLDFLGDDADVEYNGTNEENFDFSSNTVNDSDAVSFNNASDAINLEGEIDSLVNDEIAIPLTTPSEESFDFNEYTNSGGTGVNTTFDDNASMDYSEEEIAVSAGTSLATGANGIGVFATQQSWYLGSDHNLNVNTTSFHTNSTEIDELESSTWLEKMVKWLNSLWQKLQKLLEQARERTTSFVSFADDTMVELKFEISETDVNYGEYGVYSKTSIEKQMDDLDKLNAELLELQRQAQVLADLKEKYNAIYGLYDENAIAEIMEERAIGSKEAREILQYEQFGTSLAILFECAFDKDITWEEYKELLENSSIELDNINNEIELKKQEISNLQKSIEYNTLINLELYYTQKSVEHYQFNGEKVVELEESLEVLLGDNYIYMTKEQKNLYSFLFSKYGADEANNYLNYFIKFYKDQRVGLYSAMDTLKKYAVMENGLYVLEDINGKKYYINSLYDMENLPDILGLTSEEIESLNLHLMVNDEWYTFAASMFEGFEGGVEGYIQGIVNTGLLATGKLTANMSSNEWQNYYIAQFFNSEDNLGLMYSSFSSLGNQLIPLAASSLAYSLGGGEGSREVMTALTMLSSMGTYAKDGLRSGLSYEEAIKYGEDQAAMAAIIEGITIPGVGSTANTSKILKVLDLAGFGELGEEFLQQFSEIVIDAQYTGEAIDLNRFGENFVDSVPTILLSTLLMRGFSISVQGATNKIINKTTVESFAKIHNLSFDDAVKTLTSPENVNDNNAVENNEEIPNMKIDIENIDTSDAGIKKATEAFEIKQDVVEDVEVPTFSPAPSIDTSSNVSVPVNNDIYNPQEIEQGWIDLMESAGEKIRNSSSESFNENVIAPLLEMIEKTKNAFEIEINQDEESIEVPKFSPAPTIDTTSNTSVPYSNEIYNSEEIEAGWKKLLDSINVEKKASSADFQKDVIEPLTNLIEQTKDVFKIENNTSSETNIEVPIFETIPSFTDTETTTNIAAGIASLTNISSLISSLQSSSNSIFDQIIIPVLKLLQIYMKI